jgi:hypothetical protein
LVAGFHRLTIQVSIISAISTTTQDHIGNTGQHWRQTASELSFSAIARFRRRRDTRKYEKWMRPARITWPIVAVLLPGRLRQENVAA